MSPLVALLILLGPFLVVAPFAVAAAVQFESWRPPRWRAPVLRFPSIRLEVAW